MFSLGKNKTHSQRELNGTNSAKSCQDDGPCPFVTQADTSLGRK